MKIGAAFLLGKTLGIKHTQACESTNAYLNVNYRLILRA